MMLVVRTFLTVLLLAVLTLTFGQGSHPDPVTLAIGAKAPDFKLRPTDGKSYSLSSFKKANVDGVS